MTKRYVGIYEPDRIDEFYALYYYSEDPRTLHYDWYLKSRIMFSNVSKILEPHEDPDNWSNEHVDKSYMCVLRVST